MTDTFIRASQIFKVQWPASVANFCMATKTVFAIPYKEISSITFPRSSSYAPSIYQFKQLSLYSQVVISSTSRTLSLSTLPVIYLTNFMTARNCSRAQLFSCETLQKFYQHLTSEEWTVLQSLISVKKNDYCLMKCNYTESNVIKHF